MNRDERQQAAADEMRLIAYREAVSLIGCAALLIMLHTASATYDGGSGRQKPLTM